MNRDERIAELQEKQDEFIINESILPENPSWGDLLEAQAEAEARWNETDEGKELTALLEETNQ